MSNRCFFLDMNAFYAGVEQQENPALRGRPVIVVPMANVETTCAIAAGYEAKALGIQTGTKVKAARKLCPELAVVPARPELYRQYHQGIVDVLNQHFVGVKVLSIDEMACRVNRLHVGRDAEEQLAIQVKRHICETLGPMLRASVGIGPNVFLSKVASNMQKPDGLTVLDRTNLPDALFSLDLIDLPGIGARLLPRLERHGIRTVRELWAASPETLRQAWGSVVGARWHYMLRGSQDLDYGMFVPEVRKSVGHSHVLPPEFRTREGAQEILLRLMVRALKRLREYDQMASRVQVTIDYRHIYDFSGLSWSKRSGTPLHSNEDATWLKIIRPLLETIPQTRFNHQPLRASVTFGKLRLRKDVNLNLFDETKNKMLIYGDSLGNTVDALNARYAGGVELAGTYRLREQAPYRIAFGSPQ